MSNFFIKKIILVFVCIMGHCSLYSHSSLRGRVSVDYKPYSITNCKKDGSFITYILDNNALYRDRQFILFKIAVTMTIYDKEPGKYVGVGQPNFQCFYNRTIVATSSLELKNTRTDGDYNEERYSCEMLIKLKIDRSWPNSTINIPLQFKIVGSDMQFDPVEFSIMHQINIYTDKPAIDFKMLDDNNGVVIGQKQNLELTYCILNNAKCSITSKNGFYLEHSYLKGPRSKIKYNIESNSGARVNDLNDNCKVLSLNAEKTNHSLGFSIRDELASPIAGDYSDNVTISIIPNE